MKQEATKEVTTRSAPGAVMAKGFEAFSDQRAIDAEDLMLGKILVMQGLSKLVAEDRAVFGEIRDSMTGELLVPKGKDTEIIFLDSYKTWIVFEDEKFHSVVPYTSENSTLPWEEKTKDGKTITRQKTISYYCLLSSEIKKGTAFPRVMSFKSTAYKTARKLDSEATRLLTFGKPLASVVFKLFATLKEDGSKKWFIPDVTNTREINPEELKQAIKWKTVISRAKKITVDDSDLKEKEPSVSEQHTSTREF